MLAPHSPIFTPKPNPLLLHGNPSNAVHISGTYEASLTFAESIDVHLADTVIARGDRNDSWYLLGYPMSTPTSKCHRKYGDPYLFVLPQVGAVVRRILNTFLQTVATTGLLIFRHGSLLISPCVGGGPVRRRWHMLRAMRGRRGWPTSSCR